MRRGVPVCRNRDAALIATAPAAAAAPLLEAPACRRRSRECDLRALGERALADAAAIDAAGRTGHAAGAVPGDVQRVASAAAIVDELEMRRGVPVCRNRDAALIATAPAAAAAPLLEAPACRRRSRERDLRACGERALAGAAAIDTAGRAGHAAGAVPGDVQRVSGRATARGYEISLCIAGLIHRDRAGRGGTRARSLPPVEAMTGCGGRPQCHLCSDVEISLAAAPAGNAGRGAGDGSISVALDSQAIGHLATSAFEIGIHRA